MKKLLTMFVAFIVIMLTLAGCSEESSNKNSDFNAGSGSKTLKIVSGSENKELEPILKQYAEKNKVNIQVDYMGSIDMMKLLKNDKDHIKYDAIWPASSIWLSMGDKNHILKNEESVSYSPVALGIKKSKAKDLGFIGKDVTMNDIRQAVINKKLKFSMTSASQSNSGATAYFAFLSSLTKDGQVSEKTLNDAANQKAMTELLSGVDRMSSSSQFLMESFLKSNNDAMINYEALLIATNKKLEKDNKEPLYIVYPKDGTAISDSPLAYIDKGDKKTEKLFNDFQQYILSDKAQTEIEKTGKRSLMGKVSKENQHLFKKEWGIDLNKVITPIKYPDAPVIMSALNKYQTQFKKPALTFYVMDYSGSMTGEGKQQMMDALEQVMLSKNSSQNLLQGTPKDLTYAIPFDDDVMSVMKAMGNDKELSNMYNNLKSLNTRNGTNVYAGLEQVLKEIKDKHIDLSKYATSIIVMSDGMTDSDMFEEFKQMYKEDGHSIPIYSILYGDADEDELNNLAELSNAKVFDGRKDLIKAFQEVRGYN